MKSFLITGHFLKDFLRLVYMEITQNSRFLAEKWPNRSNDISNIPQIFPN